MNRLRIMISSTIEDLAQERAAVDSAIRDFRFERFRSESMGSLSRSPEQVCDEMAKECDLFILIVGEKYGWIIPHLSISVTEREFQVAKNDNPGKILVYEKSLNPNTREPPADRLLKDATDFTTGYFRAAPFENTTELVKRVKDDIAIWISSQIREGSLSPSKVFSLPNFAELLSQYALVLLSIIGLSLITVLGGSVLESWKYVLPNISAMTESAKDLYSEIGGAALSTINLSGFAWLLGVLLIPPILFVSTALFRQKYHAFLTMLSIFSIFVSIFAFSMGHLLFGVTSYVSVIIKAALPVVATILIVSASEAAKMEPKDLAAAMNGKFPQLIKNVALSAALPNSFIVAFVVVFFHDMLFQTSKGLGFLVSYGNMMFRIELSYAAIFVSALCAATVYYVIRMIQSHYAWSQIIGPALYSKIYRHPKL